MKKDEEDLGFPMKDIVDEKEDENKNCLFRPEHMEFEEGMLVSQETGKVQYKL